MSQSQAQSPTRCQPGHTVDAGEWTGMSELYWTARHKPDYHSAGLWTKVHLQDKHGDVLCSASDVSYRVIDPVPVQQDPWVLRGLCGNCARATAVDDFTSPFDGVDMSSQVAITKVANGHVTQDTLALKAALNEQRRAMERPIVYVIEEVY